MLTLALEWMRWPIPKPTPSEVDDYVASWRKFHTHAYYRRESLTAAAWRGYEKADFTERVQRFGVPWVPSGLSYRHRP